MAAAAAAEAVAAAALRWRQRASQRWRAKERRGVASLAACSRSRLAPRPRASTGGSFFAVCTGRAAAARARRGGRSLWQARGAVHGRTVKGGRVLSFSDALSHEALSTGRSRSAPVRAQRLFIRRDSGVPSLFSTCTRVLLCFHTKKTLPAKSPDLERKHHLAQGTAQRAVGVRPSSSLRGGLGPRVGWLAPRRQRWWAGRRALGLARGA